MRVSAKSPLRPYYVVTRSGLKPEMMQLIPCFYWWSQAGSNRRPRECHSRALPTELWPLVVIRSGTSETRRVPAASDPGHSLRPGDLAGSRKMRSQRASLRLRIAGFRG